MTLSPGAKFGHSLGGAVGGLHEQDYHALGCDDAKDGVEQRRLAAAGASCDHSSLQIEDQSASSALGHQTPRPREASAVISNNRLIDREISMSNYQNFSVIYFITVLSFCFQTA
jgi:hypothetical protein